MKIFWSIVAILIIGGIVYSKYTTQKNIEAFQADLLMVIKDNEPKWGRIKSISNSYSLSNENLMLAINQLIRDGLKGVHLDLNENKMVILDSYLQSCKEDSPIEDIPSEIRYHLEKVRNRLGEDKYLVNPLINELKHLIAENKTIIEKEQDKSNYSFYFGIAGCVIGIIGIVLGVIGYYFNRSELIKEIRKAFPDTSDTFGNHKNDVISST